MVEPDNIMPGPLWPAEWSTGWVTWLESDLQGFPVQGTRTIRMVIDQAVVPDSNVTVNNSPIEVANLDGAPATTNPLVVVNSAGVPCVELPQSRDTDASPYPITYVARDTWDGTPREFEVGAGDTLENPKWLSGDVASLRTDPSIAKKTIWPVELEADGIPAEALAGDWVLFKDTGWIREIEESDLP